MTVTIIKKELFVVQTELAVHPVFYVTANSVVDAAEKKEHQALLDAFQNIFRYYGCACTYWRSTSYRQAYRVGE